MSKFSAVKSLFWKQIRSQCHTQEFGFAGTPYAKGIRDTAASFKRDV